ncbi:MAG: SPOR domain-containing protein [Syntrophales bacterium]
MTVKNRRVFELRLGKVGLIVFIGVMSALLFSLFLFGVVVGKHMEAYPERYASGITEVIRDRFLAFRTKQEKGPSPAADEAKVPESDGGGADFGLTFYDTLGGKRGGAAGEAAPGGVKHKAAGSAADQAPAAGSTPVTRTEPAPGQGGAMGDAAPAPAAGGEEGAKSTPASREPAGEGEAPLPSTGETVRQEQRQFEIQVAAYRERSQAERMVKRIAAMGFAPRVMVKDLPGKGRWFRVIVGGFENRQRAQEAADRITGKIEGVKSVIRASADREGNGR